MNTKEKEALDRISSNIPLYGMSETGAQSTEDLLTIKKFIESHNSITEDLPFNFDDVKFGMAFQDYGDGFGFYVGEAPIKDESIAPKYRKKHVIQREDDSSAIILSEHAITRMLTRCPEKDIK